MGQKVSPHGLRVGVIKDWDSKWYANKANFADLLIEDNKIRKYVKKKLYTSGISRIVIERAANNKVKVNLFTAKPGMVIGKAGAGVEELKVTLEKLTGKSVIVNVNEIKRAEMEAQLVAENVAFSLERRVSFRRAMKQAIQRTMKSGAEGIKVMVSGRLGGAEMARNEKYSEGNVPLHTLRADIDYGFAEADTTYGKIGVKVWINKGEILPQTSEAVKEMRRANRAKQDFTKKPRRDNRDNRENRYNRDNRRHEEK
ncbi:30S ribosomal protein S3 [Inediibacterium massiliense]|uniref:30S ribosomal protein S3 n=1 Tax=Inediibacterium massiliense TaxID=1658111 RepID=UPI0006B5C48C